MLKKQWLGSLAVWDQEGGYASPYIGLHDGKTEHDLAQEIKELFPEDVHADFQVGRVQNRVFRITLEEVTNNES